MIVMVMVIGWTKQGGAPAPPMIINISSQPNQALLILA